MQVQTIRDVAELKELFGDAERYVNFVQRGGDRFYVIDLTDTVPGLDLDKLSRFTDAGPTKQVWYSVHIEPKAVVAQPAGARDDSSRRDPDPVEVEVSLYADWRGGERIGVYGQTLPLCSARPANDCGSADYGMRPVTFDDGNLCDEVVLPDAVLRIVAHLDDVAGLVLDRRHRHER